MMELWIIGILPLIWSAAIFATRYMVGRDDLPQDRFEKWILGLMIAPVILGLGFLCVAQLMPVTVSVPVTAPTGFDGGDNLSVATLTVAGSKASVDWLGLGLKLIAAIYGLGALFSMARLLWSQFKLGRIVVRARASDLGEGVYLSNAHITAFAYGSRIILPDHLVSRLTPDQVEMIIAHERAHIARSDTLYFTGLSWIDALFWFNPFVRMQTQRGRLAAELACDAAVADATPQMRKAYAESLLTALKHTAGDVRQYAPTVISPTNSGEFKMRLSEIMHASSASRKPRWRLLMIAAVLILPLAGLQLTWAQATAPRIVKASLVKTANASVTEIPAKLASVFAVMPTAGNLTSGYGKRLNPITHKPSFHDGVDISAPIGTPVYAPAAGHVTRADLAEPGYGKVLEIDHGNGFKTRYMHLGEFQVHVGDTVQAGQLIAKSGNTGRSTGPHTHIGVFKDGKAIDPGTVMVLPSARLAKLQGLQLDKFAVHSENFTEHTDGTYTWADALLFANGRTVKAKELTKKPSGGFTADQQEIDLKL